MRVVLSGNESIGYECLKTLLEENQEVVGVVTDKTNNETRMKNVRIRSLAKQARIKLYEPDDINGPDFLKELTALRPDMLFNIAFVKLYKAPILGIPRLGCINFHPGPLPKYGGSNGWVWAIINGEREYGVTFHYMKERIDTGNIVGLTGFPIESDETGLSLLIKCYKYGAELFRKILKDILEGTVVPVPQNLSERTYYYNKVPYEGITDVSWDAVRIYNFVRAMSFAPFPNPLSPAMITFKGAKLIITRAKVLEETAAGKFNPGEVIDIRQDGVVMQTGKGAVLLSLLDGAMRSADTIQLCGSKGIGKGSILG